MITVYGDKSFSFITKSPPAPVLLKQAAKVEKGAADPLREKVGEDVTYEQLHLARAYLNRAQRGQSGQ